MNLIGKFGLVNLIQRFRIWVYYCLWKDLNVNTYKCYTTRKRPFIDGQKPSQSKKIRHKVIILWRLCDGLNPLRKRSWKSLWRPRSSQTKWRHFVTAPVVNKFERQLFWTQLSDRLGRHKIQISDSSGRHKFLCQIRHKVLDYLVTA